MFHYNTQNTYQANLCFKIIPKHLPIISRLLNWKLTTCRGPSGLELLGELELNISTSTTIKASLSGGGETIRRLLESHWVTLGARSPANIRSRSHQEYRLQFSRHIKPLILHIIIFIHLLWFSLNEYFCGHFIFGNPKYIHTGPSLNHVSF